MSSPLQQQDKQCAQLVASAPQAASEVLPTTSLGGHAISSLPVIFYFFLGLLLILVHLQLSS